MEARVPYCGLPPLPGELLSRFNLDPVAIVVLLGIAIFHVARIAPQGRSRTMAGTGWTIAAAAFFSPLCALSVALFSARIGQHMILVLLAAPLIAWGWPHRGKWSGRLLAANTACFALALWFWHMPGPYAATFRSDAVYWAMHLTLFGSAIFLWRDLLHHPAEQAFAPLAAGLMTTVQMGLLGAILTFAAIPLFGPHLATSGAWGLAPLADQQFGGLLMWVPGMVLFIWAAKVSLDHALDAPGKGSVR
ncbi:cytochrome c oxidase assembly protein [Novosphingobium marinum]|uniref:Putative membrane protein n=1 Tax=Novosphingobium marinum TaxID=1514948 RepID=A0A7Y9XV91_9SPHN|nr:cytochrome c oxidase assembly protein [Novosphingobium marinum]NYH93793.1 putative membrane protein [Novosphingobium marinum]